MLLFGVVGCFGKSLFSTLVVLILLHLGILLLSQIEFLGLQISLRVRREEVPGVHIPPFSDFCSAGAGGSLASLFDRRVVRRPDAWPALVLLGGGLLDPSDKDIPDIASLSSLLINIKILRNIPFQIPSFLLSLIYKSPNFLSPSSQPLSQLIIKFPSFVQILRNLSKLEIPVFQLL